MSVLVYDSAGNYLNDTATIDLIPYILPTVSGINPTNATINTSTQWMAIVTQGSFALSNITWEFPNGNYIKNLPVIGANYQQWTYNQSGVFSTTIQICDVNNFCSQSVSNVYIASTTPPSYWTIGNANVITNLTYLNPEKVTFTFIPYNDTNPIYSVQIFWGDGYSDTYQYTGTTTTGTYSHSYYNLGTYNLSATICDTIGNCYNTFITNITYEQNIFGLSSALISTSPINGGIGTPFLAFEDDLQQQFGSLLGAILFWIVCIIVFIIIAIIIGIILMIFAGEAIKEGFKSFKRVFK